MCRSHVLDKDSVVCSVCFWSVILYKSMFNGDVCEEIHTLGQIPWVRG